MLTSSILPAPLLVDADTGEALLALEIIIERLREAARREDLSAETAQRFVHLGEELNSHALAARVLAVSGASENTLRNVMKRAVAILDDEREQGLLAL